MGKMALDEYKPAYADLVRRLCLLGSTQAEMAEALGVSIATLKRWTMNEPGFRAAIADGRKRADAQVANALYKRAVGYEYTEDDIRVASGQVVITPIKRVMPPDPSSAQFWLRNRAKEYWREKVEVTGAGGGAIEVITYAGPRPK